MARSSGDEFGVHDQARLAFAGGIIASWFAYLQVHAEIARWIGEAAYRYGLLTISTSAILSFLFLLSVAAQVKYVRKGRLDEISLTRTDKVAFYDLSVDAFELIPWIILYGSLHARFAQHQTSGVAWAWAGAAAIGLWALFFAAIKLLTWLWVSVQTWRTSERAVRLINSRLGIGLLFFVLGVVIAVLAA